MFRFRSMIAIAILAWMACPVNVSAQATVRDITGAAPDSQYEPSPAFPFGRPNPGAPKELGQFEFMIGEFDCIDELRQPDGSVLKFDAIWNARYFLNGFGIQDHYWTPDQLFSTSNIRIFDPQEKKWKVTFFRMPGYQSGVWEGGKEGASIVLRPGGRTSGPGLTFHHITKGGFLWHSGGDTPSWRSTCVRRR